MSKKPLKAPSNKISKRPFHSLSEDSSPTNFQAFSREKTSKNHKNKKFTHYFSGFPEHLLSKILSFLPNSLYFDLKLINKDFYQVVSQLFTDFDFKNQDAIPFETLQKIIKNGGKPTKLRFGRLNNVNSELFLQNIIGFLQLKHLEVLDFGSFSELNDEILLKCLEKTDFNLISELSLPYSCKITNVSLDFIEKNLKKLILFSHTSNYCSQENKNFQQETLKNIILNNNNSLVEFRVETLNQIFFQELNKTDLILKNLMLLKIKNLQFEEINQIKLFEALRTVCPNIVKLVLLEIFVKNRIIEQDYEEVLQAFEKLLQNLKDLKFLKLGHFTSQRLLEIINVNCPNLEIFKVISEKLSMDELREFFFSSLNIITVSGNIGREYGHIVFQRRRIFFLIG